MLKSNREIYQEEKRRVTAISFAAGMAKAFKFLLSWLSAAAFFLALCTIDSEGEAFMIVLYVLAFSVAMGIVAYGFHLLSRGLEDKVRIKRRALKMYFLHSVKRIEKEERFAA